METNVKMYKDYVIVTKKGKEKGLFFRSPIQKVSFDAYYGEAGELSAYTYADKIEKSSIRRFFETLIGNGRIVKNLNEWIKDYDFGGFDANKLCFPIYFSRQFRSLEAVSQNPETLIKKIVSYGYESEWEFVAGGCKKETTTITMKNGQKVSSKTTERFDKTYEHIIEKILADSVAE